MVGAMGPEPAQVVRVRAAEACVNATLLKLAVAHRWDAATGSTVYPSLPSTLPAWMSRLPINPERTVTSSKPTPVATANAAHTDDGTLL
jgi:hypothetical protein